MKEKYSLKVGYVCEWEKEPRKTWSGITSSLYQALCGIDDIRVDNINVTPSNTHLFLHKIFTARKYNGRTVSKYRYSYPYLRALERKLQKSVKDSIEKPDVLLQIGDIGYPGLDIPFFLYQDVCLEYILNQYKVFPPGVFSFDMYTRQETLRRKDWQTRVRGQATGIFAMSQWFADLLVREAGYDRKNIHVVHAGINVRPQLSGGILPEKAPHEKIILFVGREFVRKGGELVVQAFKEVYEQYSDGIRLVVAGPRAWPLPGAIPPGITFLGDANWETLYGYYTIADVFCMPSYYEAFGIVFPEALSFGVPCIGRNDFAMPEIIRDGDNGYLLKSDTTLELAELLIKVIRNEEMKQRVGQQAMSVRTYYSWERVAQDMVRVMQSI